MSALRALCALACLGLSTAAVSAEKWLDLKSGSQAIVLAPTDKPGKLPALVMLPYTDGTSIAIYSRYSKAIKRFARQNPMVVVLPPGRNDSDDYDSYEDFSELISEWDGRVRGVVRELSAAGWIDPNRVVLGGHSMGGDLSWALALKRPKDYLGALVMGSRCSYRPKPPVNRLRTPAFFLSMGVSDSDSRRRGMHAAVRFLAYRGEHFLYRQYKGGHVSAPEDLFGSGLSYLMTAERPAPTKPPAPAQKSATRR